MFMLRVPLSCSVVTATFMKSKNRLNTNAPKTLYLSCVSGVL